MRGPARGRPPRPRFRAPARPAWWTAVALGVAAAAAYAAGAWLSGVESPLARRPILDIGPQATPYRWVHPPAALKAGNTPPVSAHFTGPTAVRVVGGRSQAGVLSTNDQQASLVLSLGALAVPPGTRSVDVSVVPLDPATLGHPKAYTVLGNAYRFTASSVPGDRPVTGFAASHLVNLYYPAVVTRSLRHVILYSRDGNTWTPLKTTDDFTVQQASARTFPGLGYFAVGSPGRTSSPLPPAGSTGGSALPWIVIAAAGGLAVVLLAIRMLGRPGRGRHEGSRGRTGRPRASGSRAAPRRREPRGRDDRDRW